jgi:predicted nucleic acid-binding protein
MPGADKGVHRFQHPDLCRRSGARQSGTLAPVFASWGTLSLGVTLADTDRASDLVCAIRSSARDAVHATVMLNNDVEWIATFDSGFDDIPGIRRMKLP